MVEPSFAYILFDMFFVKFKIPPPSHELDARAAFFEIYDVIITQKFFMMSLI